MKQKHMLFNRCLALALIMVLSFTLLPMADTSAKSSKTTVSMKAKKVPSYAVVLSQVISSEETLYFNGKSDIPYYDLESARKAVEAYLQLNYPSGLTLSSKAKGNTVTWTRTAGGLSFKVVFDYKKNTITFDDVDAFFRQEGLSLVCAENGMRGYYDLFQSGDCNYNRYGKKYMIDLNKYGIKLLKDKKKYYIPFQTISDIFYSKFLAIYLYNGEALFSMAYSSQLPEELNEIYNKPTKKAMSKEYAAFNYGELCLVLDYLYGLKETHNIKSFDAFFTETGLGAMIKKQESIGTDMALYTAINLYFDDLHCNFRTISNNTDRDQFIEKIQSIPNGSFRTRFDNLVNELDAYRKNYMPNGVLPYQEVGDTAYITLDQFIVDATQDHTVLPTDEELPALANDTLRLVQYAMSKITRIGSPIKRVVLDLSNNSGGMIYTGIYVLSAFLGSSSLAMQDTVTGAQSMADYKADTNLDGVFDEKDTLAGRGLKLYCFTSGVTYSCANLVAAVFKDSGKVNLVGRVSGGGSCGVAYASTASGSAFDLSGSSRFSFSKNGGFYDVDRGAEPDVFVNDMSKLYDREYMNTFLDKVS
ncbi:MAG: hypothetical protein J5819_07730 [Eubacterium sp.]|nr:hypothetical protein [Eubacterium sp.]